MQENNCDLICNASLELTCHFIQIKTNLDKHLITLTNAALMLQFTGYLKNFFHANKKVS